MQQEREYRIIESTFIKSSTKLQECPNPHLPEYAFIGRSNVGKSSLINYLCDRKSLAMTSGKPGKTRVINHFLIDKSWYLVDLPGYGYARVSKSERRKFEQMIRDYLLHRPNLSNVFILIDANISPQKIDLEFIEWLGISSIPFTIIFTKADKSKDSSLNENLEAFLKALSESWEELPKHIVTSSSKRFGREEVLALIAQTNDQVSNLIKNK